MFGFKTSKRLKKEIVSMRREYTRLNNLLIRRTTALASQETKANELQADSEKLIDKAFAQDQEIRRLARVIIQASRGGSAEELEAFCTTADSLCERFPDLAPQPGTDG